MANDQMKEDEHHDHGRMNSKHDTTPDPHNHRALHMGERGTC